MQSINSANTKISSLSAKIQELETKTNSLEVELKKNVHLAHPSTENQPPTTDITPKPKIIDCDLLLLVDSNGKLIQEDKINKNLKCQKFSTMKLEDAKDIVLKAKFKTCPVKVLMNVGINILDSDTSNEIRNKYEDCIEALKSKIPNVAIYVNSIFLRKGNKFYNETIEVNTFMKIYSKLHQNVHFINNCNIENNQMFDAILEIIKCLMRNT